MSQEEEEEETRDRRDSLFSQALAKNLQPRPPNDGPEMQRDRLKRDSEAMNKLKTDVEADEDKKLRTDKGYEGVGLVQESRDC